MNPNPVALRWWLHALSLATAVSVLSCGGGLQAARDSGRSARLGAVVGTAPSSRCVTLDDRRTVLGGLAKTALALGSAATLSLLLPEVRDSRGARIVVVGGSVTFAATGAGLQLAADNSAASWVRECQ